MSLSIEEILSEINEKKEVKACPICHTGTIVKRVRKMPLPMKHLDVFECINCQTQGLIKYWNHRPLEDRYKAMIRGLVESRRAAEFNALCEIGPKDRFYDMEKMNKYIDEIEEIEVEE